MKKFDFGYKNLEQIVEMINDADKDGVQGFEEMTADYLAASYAKAAAEEEGYGDEPESWEAHLEILADNGAEFDKSNAVEVIKKFED